MGLMVQGSVSDFDLVDEGTYPATFTGYSEPMQGTKFPNPDGSFPTLTSLIYKIDDSDDDFPGTEVRSKLGKISLHEKSTMGQHVRVLVGREFDEQESYDLDQLVGTKVMINVKQREKENGTFSDVVSITPMRKKRKAVEDDPFDDE